MTTYYLRMEAVNLSNFVYDTQDLSTVRGAGLLLLDAVHKIRDADLGLAPVSLGASSGLFQFDVQEPVEAEQLRDQVKSQLRGDPDLRHATFVVDVWPATDDFVRDREALLASKRWRQMQQPRQAIPEWNERTGIGACEHDLVRPATTMMRGPEGMMERVSLSVEARRTYGRAQKQQFYHQQTNGQVVIEREFAFDFNELTSDTHRGNLHHKMAVIYLDGNSFGKLQNEECRTAQTQKDFDETVRECRRKVLIALLKLMAEKSDGWISEKERYRLETLLWGGDEITWVVPAWQGWKALSLFYQQARDWRFAERRLTHSAGMVFCHHNAPIHRIKDLAVSLAELAKRKGRKGTTLQNLFAYQVLESFDHVGRDLEKFRQERLPEREDPDTLVLPGEGMGEAESAFAVIKASFPRGKLHQIVQQLRGDPQQAEKTIGETTRDLPQSVRAALDKLRDYLGDTRTYWPHIADLWDYVGD